MADKFVPGRSNGTVERLVDTGKVDPVGGLPVLIPARQMVSGNIACLGYQRVTSTGSVFGLPSIPESATTAVLRAETQGLRWRDDDTDPTASVGMPLNTADAPFVYDGSLAALKLIAATAGAILHISYYG